MKKFLLTLIALVMSIGMSWADKTIYFEPNQWDKNDKTEFFAAYAWGGGSDGAWYDPEAVEGTTYYKFTIPDSREGLLFTRAESEADKHTWGEKWNQTIDINLSTVDDNSAIIFTAWGNAYNKSTVVSTAFSPYTVKFATKSAWENIYAYTYGEAATGDWPGKKMTATDEKVYDLSTFTTYKIYSISFLATAAPSNIIFDNGGSGAGNQTGDLAFTNNKLYLDGIQENLAYGTTVTWGDDDDHTEGIQNGTLNNITDGNDGTAFQCNFGDKTVFSVVLDLGEAKTFNSLLINQTGDRWNTSFQIFVSDDNSAWTEVTAKTSGIISGKFIATFTAQTARYVKYYTTKANKNVTDVYGASLAEIQLYNLDAVPTLSSITLSALSTSIVAGFTTTLTATGASSLSGVAIGLGDITWNNDNTTTGTITDGVYTGAAAGTSVVSATVDEITSNTVSITVLAAASEPSTPTIDENKISIYVGDTEHLPTGFNKHRVADYQGDGWTRKALEYTSGHNVEFTMTALDVSGMEKIHIDIFPNETTTLALFVNGTGTSWNGYDLNEGNEIPAGAWYSEDIPVSFFTETCNHDMSTLTNMVFCKKVADKTGHAGFYDFSSPYKSFLIGNIYFWKAAQKTVTFVNNGNWANVYAYAWYNDGENDIPVTAAWPGDEITAGLTWNTTGEPTYIIFNNGDDPGVAGNTKTNDLAFEDGATYNVQGKIGNYTITFINEEKWSKVYVHAYGKDSNNNWYNINGWPGDEMTDNGDGTFTWNTTYGSTAFVKFANQDGTFPGEASAFIDGATYNYIGIPDIIGYYIVGSMNGWTVGDADYKMVQNAGADHEYMKVAVPLTNTDQFKIVYTRDGVQSTWYPASAANFNADGSKITTDGDYTVYFNTAGDGDLNYWYEGYIFAGIEDELADRGIDATTGAHVLSGPWDGGAFGTLDSNVKATSYDVTNLAATFDGGVINTAKKNALFIARADQNIGKNKVVDNGDGTYTGANIEILDYSEYGGQDTEMNTQISPITGTINYHRTLPAANVYFTQVIPFTMAVPANITAYEATTSTSSAGVVNVTFSEVTTMQAGVPYLLTATDAGAHFLNATSLDFSAGSDANLTDCAFKATYAPVNPVPANTYVVAKGSTSAEFRPASTGSYIPAFRAYLTVPSGDAKINVLIEDTDGIHAATAEQLEGIFNIYSIDGKLVRQNSDSAVGLNKGVYIINGKKVVVK